MAHKWDIFLPHLHYSIMAMFMFNHFVYPLLIQSSLVDLIPRVKDIRFLFNVWSAASNEADFQMEAEALNELMVVRPTLEFFVIPNYTNIRAAEPYAGKFCGIYEVNQLFANILGKLLMAFCFTAGAFIVTCLCILSVLALIYVIDVSANIITTVGNCCKPFVERVYRGGNYAVTSMSVQGQHLEKCLIQLAIGSARTCKTWTNTVSLSLMPFLHAIYELLHNRLRTSVRAILFCFMGCLVLCISIGTAFPSFASQLAFSCCQLLCAFEGLNFLFHHILPGKHTKQIMKSSVVMLKEQRQGSDCSEISDLSRVSSGPDTQEKKSVTANGVPTKGPQCDFSSIENDNCGGILEAKYYETETLPFAYTERTLNQSEPSPAPIYNSVENKECLLVPSFETDIVMNAESSELSKAVRASPLNTHNKTNPSTSDQTGYPDLNPDLTEACKHETESLVLKVAQQRLQQSDSPEFMYGLTKDVKSAPSSYDAEVGKSEISVGKVSTVSAKLPVKEQAASFYDSTKANPFSLYQSDKSDNHSVAGRMKSPVVKHDSLAPQTIMKDFHAALEEVKDRFLEFTPDALSPDLSQPREQEPYAREDCGSTCLRSRWADEPSNSQDTESSNLTVLKRVEPERKQGNGKNQASVESGSGRVLNSRWADEAEKSQGITSSQQPILSSQDYGYHSLQRNETRDGSGSSQETLVADSSLGKVPDLGLTTSNYNAKGLATSNRVGYIFQKVDEEQQALKALSLQLESVQKARKGEKELEYFRSAREQIPLPYRMECREGFESTYRDSHKDMLLEIEDLRLQVTATLDSLLEYSSTRAMATKKIRAEIPKPHKITKLLELYATGKSTKSVHPKLARIDQALKELDEYDGKLLYEAEPLFSELEKRMQVYKARCEDYFNASGNRTNEEDPVYCAGLHKQSKAIYRRLNR